jgi:type 1 glutamine amidotransferase
MPRPFSELSFNKCALCLCVSVAFFLVACKPSQSAPGSPTPAPAGPIVRVLMLTATVGFRHDSIATARGVLPALGTANRFNVTATEDLSIFTPANLANYDVVMFAMTSGELPLGADQKSALLDFVTRGGGFIGFHSATDTLYEWPDYDRLIGAHLIDHPWTQTARVLVEDAAHPAAGARDSFSIEEEFYVFRSNPRGRVQVLMRLDPASVGTTGDYPLVWAQPFGSGRSYYNALGHFPSTWRDARFHAQVVAAIKWTAGQ